MALLTLALVGARQLEGLLGRWGYALVFTFAGLQSLGAPLPGTTAVIVASLYAGRTHHLQIVGVILAAAGGAVGGSVLAFLVGRLGGVTWLARHGHRIGLTPARLSLGVHLFDVHGVKIVFFGRFITGMRNVVALLAGAGGMPAGRFLATCTVAASVWATVNGLGSYLFGAALQRAGTPLAVALTLALIVSLVLPAALLRRRGGP